MKNDRVSWSSPRPTSMATAPATSSGPFVGRLPFWLLSGKDGSLLWTYSADPGESATPRSAEDARRPGPRSWAHRQRSTSMATASTDLVAEFAVFDDPQGLVDPAAPEWPGCGMASREYLRGRRIVVAVSGRSGKELWNYAIDQKPTDLTE